MHNIFPIHFNYRLYKLSKYMYEYNEPNHDVFILTKFKIQKYMFTHYLFIMLDVWPIP